MSPSLGWLAWLGLARLASAWLVSSAAATTPEEADKTTGAALRAAPVVVAASSGVVAVVVAAADETSHAEARRAKPSQASQSREGLTNSFGCSCDASPFPRGRPGLLTTDSGSGYSRFEIRPIAGRQGWGMSPNWVPWWDQRDQWAPKLGPLVGSNGTKGSSNWVPGQWWDQRE